MEDSAYSESTCFLQSWDRQKIVPERILLLLCPERSPEIAFVNTLIDELKDDEFCSLREAILANNAGRDMYGCSNPQGVITFAPDLPKGTITLQNSGMPPITRSVFIAGPGAEKLTVSGDEKFRVFDIGENLIVDIFGLTISHGRAPEIGDAIDFARVGGGIRSGLGTRLTIQECQFSNNTAPFQGGGIYSSLLTVVDSTFMNNRAWMGGAIHVNEDLMVTDTIFKNNWAAFGAGINAEETMWNRSGVTATVKNSVFEGNHARALGGGIYSGNGAYYTVLNSTFKNNRSDHSGGGIFFFHAATVSSSLFLNNFAVDEGGGIQFYSQLTVEDSIFSGNQAAYGGGIHLVEGSNNPSAYTQRYRWIEVMNSDFEGNLSRVGGGAIRNTYGNVTLQNNRFGRASFHGLGRPNWPDDVNTLRGNTGSGNRPTSCDRNWGFCQSRFFGIPR